jgi:hypothetical protein
MCCAGLPPRPASAQPPPWCSRHDTTFTAPDLRDLPGGEKGKIHHHFEARTGRKDAVIPARAPSAYGRSARV